MINLNDLSPPEEFNLIPKQFWVIGYPIARSKSPMIHNTGYTVRGLPHVFSIHEVQELAVEDIESKLRAPDFGGAAITMPFKVSIMKFLDEITPAAKQLGAVNTIIPRVNLKGESVLIGHNTDWNGMYGVLYTGLKPSHEKSSKATALIIGGGGAARAGVYALKQLGIKTIYIYNRTQSKILELIKDFDGFGVDLVAIESLASKTFENNELPIFIVGTVPAKATMLTLDSGPEGKAIHLPSDIFSRPQGGVMLDMAYLPKRTPLVQLAEQSGSQWIINPGIMILLQQAFAQFKIWTGVDAPQREMTEATLKLYEAEESALK